MAGVSEVIGDTEEEAASRSELGSADADAGAVAKLVAFIEEVDDIEAEFECLAAGVSVEGDDVLNADVYRVIFGLLGGVGEAAAEAVAVEEVDVSHVFFVVPFVGSA